MEIDHTYDMAAICENGHLVSATVHEAAGDVGTHCTRCGGAIYSGCPHCGADIRGARISISENWATRNITRRPARHYRVPAFCESCGKPLPWTERTLAAAQELVAELDGLSDEERQRLAQSLPDLLTDGPGTEVAQTRLKKVLAKLRGEARSLLVDVVSQMASTTVKQHLGL